MVSHRFRLEIMPAISEKSQWVVLDTEFESFNHFVIIMYRFIYDKSLQLFNLSGFTVILLEKRALSRNGDERLSRTDFALSDLQRSYFQV